MDVESSVRNSIGVSSHQRAEKRILPQVAVEIVKPEHNVSEGAVPVRRPQGNDTAPEIRDFDFRTRRIGQRKKADRLAGGIEPPVLFSYVGCAHGFLDYCKPASVCNAFEATAHRTVTFHG